jgi:hypothetical protein
VPSSEKAINLSLKSDIKLVCKCYWYYFCANLSKDSIFYNGNNNY